MNTQNIKSSIRGSNSASSKQYKAVAVSLLALLLAAPSLASAASNRAPSAIISASANSGVAPFATTLDGVKSRDYDGKIASYSWNFGDGTTSQSRASIHTYTQAGTFKASLKVTDNKGATSSTSVTVTVQEPPSMIPAGVYSVVGSAAPMPDSLLTNPDIEGVVLRDVWSNIETQEGVYDWTYLDDQIQLISDAGKKVSLVINSGGQDIPAWVMKPQVQKFSFINKNTYQASYNTKMTIPVFWDPIYLQKKIAFIKAAGQRYASNPNIVVFDAQCANAVTADWNVPSSKEDVAAWNAAGFSSDKVLTACEQVLDATMDAFPGKPVKMAIGRISAQLDSYANADYIQDQLTNYANSAYPGRFLAIKANLSATTSDPMQTSDLGAWQVLYNNQPDIGAQMLWFVSDETSCRMNNGVKPCDAYTMLDKTINVGLNYGMQYLEIYQSDIDNPELAGIIHQTAVTLGTY